MVHRIWKSVILPKTVIIFTVLIVRQNMKKKSQSPSKQPPAKLWDRLLDKYIFYLKTERNYSPHTLSAYNADLNQFIGFLEKGNDQKDVNKINRQTLRSFLVYLKNADYKPKSINRKIACIRNFYKYLLKNSLVDVNPASTLFSMKTLTLCSPIINRSRVISPTK